MTNYNDGKWHGWNGGECPVHPETVVEALWVDPQGGYHKVGPKVAEDVAWTMREISGYGTCVSAFRVIKEHKEPREFWVIAGVHHGSLSEAEKDCQLWGFDTSEIIHVREVTP